MIGASTSEQQTGIDRIARAIRNASATTRQMAWGAEQIQRAAESLSQLAERLEEITIHSRVADGAPHRRAITGARLRPVVWGRQTPPRR